MSSTTNLSVPKNAESDSISITTLPITGKRKAAAINKALNEVKLKKRKLREELKKLTKRSTELEGWLFQQKVKRLEDMYKKISLRRPKSISWHWREHVGSAVSTRKIHKILCKWRSVRPRKINNIETFEHALR